MKKILISALLPMVLLILCSCGKNSTPSAASSTPDADASKQQEAEESASDEDSTGMTTDKDASSASTQGADRLDKIASKTLVTELISEDGTAEAPDGTKYEYSFHIPQIDDDTPDAISINKEIDEMCTEPTNDSLSAIKDKDDASYKKLTYETYYSDHVLSIVIAGLPWESSSPWYSVYMYDLDDGKQVDETAILHNANLSNDDYIKELQSEALRHFDDNNFQDWADGKINSGTYVEMRSRALNPEKLTESQTLFVDEKGRINAITLIPTCDDTMQQEILCLDFNDVDQISKKIEVPELITAELENGEVYLSFSNNAINLFGRATSGIFPDTKIKATTPYGRYTDIAWGYHDGDPVPYLFLLTKEGRVEYIDISTGLIGGFLGSAGPVCKAQNVTKLVLKNDSYGSECLFGIGSDQQEWNLCEFASLNKAIVSPNFQNTWHSLIYFDTDGGGGYEEDYWITLHTLNDVELTSHCEAAGVDLSQHGAFTYLGMNEDGVVYYYYMRNDDYIDSTSEGSCALRYDYTFNQNAGAYTNSLFFTEVSGSGMISTREHEVFEFEETVG